MDAKILKGPKWCCAIHMTQLRNRNHCSNANLEQFMKHLYSSKPIELLPPHNIIRENFSVQDWIVSIRVYLCRGHFSKRMTLKIDDTVIQKGIVRNS